MDERADTLDVTATIVDLAVRGYLKITEVEKKWLFGSRDYTLDRLREDTDESDPLRTPPPNRPVRNRAFGTDERS